MAALILAVDRFDPANGRLKTYAWQWMRGAILKAELANYSIGPLGGTKQQHLFFNLNKEKAKRGISFVGGEGEAASIGRTLSTDRFNLTAKDVLLAEARVASMAVTFRWMQSFIQMMTATTSLPTTSLPMTVLGQKPL